MTELNADAENPLLDLEARNQAIAGRLFVAADAFLFLAFLFAYLYLRALNNNHMWNPHGQNPSGTMGLVVLVLVVATAAIVQVGAGRLFSAGARAFRTPAIGALVVGLVATVLVASQVFRPGFSPSHAGGIGSVFIGFVAVYLVHLLGALYWLETQAVQPSDETLRATVPPCALYWWFLAVVLAIFSVLFYLA
jgi:heme/copper-type cytochrome/quinol oxidase subunit 3